MEEAGPGKVPLRDAEENADQNINSGFENETGSVFYIFPEVRRKGRTHDGGMLSKKKYRLPG